MHRPYLEPPVPRAFAHRGWHIDDLAGMENSLAGFRRAVDEGYLHLETDVQVTSDGIIVVHHDESLDRTTDRSGVISDLPWSEVRRARIAGKEPICRLEDLLEEVPDVRINIDVKTDKAAEPFVRVIERTGAVDRVAAASFSARRVDRIRKLAGPDLVMAMGSDSIAVAWFSGWLPLLPFGFLTRGAMAQVPMHYRGRRLVDARFVRAVHRIGAEVHVWTIDDAAQMNALLDIGVDGLVTDRPDVLRDVLQARGAWVNSAPSPARPPATS